jgi:hypothetical protein
MPTVIPSLPGSAVHRTDIELYNATTMTAPTAAQLAASKPLSSRAVVPYAAYER